MRVEVRGLGEAQEGLRRQRAEVIPAMLRRIRFNVALCVKAHAIENASGPVLKRRSGSLVNFVARQQPEVLDDAVVWGLQNTDLQARIGAFQETGGRVVPKVAKMLRIPLDAAKTPAGVDRYAGIPLRTVPGFWVKQATAGRLLLMRTPDHSPKAAPQAWYLLVHSSEVQPHPWFSRAVEQGQAEVPGLIAAAIRQAEVARG